MPGLRRIVAAVSGRSGAGAATTMPHHRPMTAADVPAVLAIEQAAYPFPWTHGNFIDSLAAGYQAMLRLEGGGRVVAYSIAQPGFEETHLLNLTVDPARQRQGHGRALLLSLAAWARQRGDTALWLEVRPSNRAGLGLYRQSGFDEVGLRRHYYPAEHGGREDAVVMRLDLLASLSAKGR